MRRFSEIREGLSPPDFDVSPETQLGDVREKSVIVVSPYFPPSSLAGVHRARHLLKHLPAHGWHTTLVCVDERHYEQEPDPLLAALVPADADIERVNAIPISWTRPFGLGEIGIRAFAQLRARVQRAVSGVRAAVVLITGSPFYPMLMAPGLKAKGARVVLDFQDPWVSDWGATRPRWSKGGLAHWLATQLEPHAVRGADFITAVSARQNADMAARYPFLAADRFADIPIGGDPDDFTRFRLAGTKPTAGLLAAGKLNFSFVGTFMPRSGPLMRSFLLGLRQFRSAFPDQAESVRFNFIGTGNHSGATQTPVLDLARDVGVADLVFELPQRIGYSGALTALAQSDAVLLLGSDEPHYTASKIYPGLMCGRPFVSLFHVASSSHDILTRAGGGIAIGYEPEEDQAETVAAVAAALHRLVLAPGSVGAVDRSAYADFEAHAVAGRYAAIFDRLVGCA